MLKRTPHSDHMIEIRGLTKKFGKVTAIAKINISLYRGITIIAGPNGAGKSTLLRCIDGLYKPDAGVVYVNNKNPYTNDSIRNKLSLLTDNYALYDNLSVMQNLMFFGKLYKLSPATIKKRSQNLLAKLSAKQFSNSKVYSLSRGTKQKVALSRALLCDPEILLLDEPTAFLDPKASASVRNIITEMSKEGKTIVFVTQKVNEIPRFKARLLFLNNGKIVKDTTTYEFYRSMAKGAIVEIRLAIPIKENTAISTPGFVSGNTKNPTLIRIRIKSYKDISTALAYLSSKGAYVLGVDYTESIIKKFS